MSIFNLNERLLDGQASKLNHPTFSALPKQCTSAISLGGLDKNVKIWLGEIYAYISKIFEKIVVRGRKRFKSSNII